MHKNSKKNHNFQKLKNSTIVPLSEQNFERFLFLLERLAEYEHLTPPDKAAKQRLKNDGLCEKPKYYAYLCLKDGAAIGYLIYFMAYSSFLALPSLYIEDIFILKEYRRQGYGQMLFDFCVTQAEEAKCGRMEWCVLTWNKPAINFYEKNNAQKLDWYFYRFDKKQIHDHNIVH